MEYHIILCIMVTLSMVNMGIANISSLQVVLKYLSIRDVHPINLFVCNEIGPDEENINFRKLGEGDRVFLQTLPPKSEATSISSSAVPTISVSISNSTSEERILSAFIAQHYIIGVVLALECSYAATILEMVKEFERKLVGKKEYYDAQYLTSVDDLPRCSCKLHQYAEFVMNFKTDLGITPDWGYFNKTTQKFDRNSMYGQLEDGKIEFGLALSWMYSARVNVAFFAPATRILKSCVVFRHPPAGASMHAFALPFTSGTWIVTFVYVFTISVCLSVMRHQRQLNETDDPPGERQFSANFFLVAGIMCLQGSLIESIRIPLRILTFFLQLLALMVYSYYGATILGFLLTPTPRTITTVERLLDSHMDLWVENVSFHRHHFHAGISARATKYYDEAIKGPTPDQDKIIDRIVGLKSVQKGGTALYGLAPNLFENVQKLFSSSEICSLHYIHMLDMQTAIPVRKQSPYREMYNIAIQRILETGFADYEERTWHAQKPDCVGSEATAAVKLEATFIALMIYAVGFAIALIIFAVERILPPKSNWGESKKRLTDVTYL